MKNERSQMNVTRLSIGAESRVAGLGSLGMNQPYGYKVFVI